MDAAPELFVVIGLLAEIGAAGAPLAFMVSGASPALAVLADWQVRYLTASVSLVALVILRLESTVVRHGLAVHSIVWGLSVNGFGFYWIDAAFTGF